MKRYRADIAYIRINTIEIENEKGNRIYFRNGKYETNGGKYHKYFITWDEAKQYLIDYFNEEISKIYRELNEARADLRKAENLSRSGIETTLIIEEEDNEK